MAEDDNPGLGQCSMALLLLAADRGNRFPVSTFLFDAKID